MGNLCSCLNLFYNSGYREPMYLTNFSANAPKCLKHYNNKQYSFQEFVYLLTRVINNQPSIEKIAIIKYMCIDEDHYVNIPLHNCIVFMPETYPELLQTWIEHGFLRLI